MNTRVRKPTLLHLLALSAAVLGAGLVAGFAAIPASAAVKLSLVKTKPETLIGADAETIYSGAKVIWIECPGNSRTLMAGWTNAGAPVHSVFSHGFADTGMLGIGALRPAKTKKIRAIGLCAKGSFAAVAKEVSGSKVTCSARQLALGMPIDGGPILDAPVASVPVGKRAWSTTGQGEYARSKAICVAASAFKKVKLVKRTARFALGKPSTALSATCARGTRPIAWGFEAGTLDQNALTKPGYDPMSVPFVAAATPKGARGWALTFATPDGAGARTSTSLALHVTCAQPR